MNISAEQHVHVLAAAQRNVDNSVSKTCNGAVNDTVESVDALYRLGRQLGCKAVSYYRDGSRENQVLTSMKAEEPKGEKACNPEAAVANIGQLALLARGRVAPSSPESRAALQFGQLHAARQNLVQNLFRPDLSPTLVADLLGVSVRQIHRLFEPTGESFSRTLTTLRLAEAHQQLRGDVTRPVADIAFACGFESLATFYRVFRRAYGLSPGDVRAASTS